MKRSTWLWLLGLALCVGLAYWYIGKLLIPSSAAARVVRGNLIQTVSGTVSVSAQAESTIPSPDNGFLKESFIKEGSVVGAGDVIGRLDPGDLPFHKNQVMANITQYQTQLAGKLPSEIHYEGLKKELADADALRANAYYPILDYDRLSANTREAEMTAHNDRQDMETKLRITQIEADNTDDYVRRLTILAPYNGTITAIGAYPGDLLSKGRAVAKIISTDLKVVAEVNQDDIASVHPDEKVEVRFFAYPSETAHGSVKMVLPTTETASQRFGVMLDLENFNDKLVSGLTGEVSFLAGEHDNTLIIPRRALLGQNVIVANNGRVEVRKVTPGYTSLTEAEILDGLQEGDLVLTENLDLFRDGERVNITSVVTDKKKPAPKAP